MGNVIQQIKKVLPKLIVTHFVTYFESWFILQLNLKGVLDLQVNPLDATIVFIQSTQFLPKKHLHTDSSVRTILLYVELTDCFNIAYKPVLEMGQVPQIASFPAAVSDLKMPLVWFFCSPNHLWMTSLPNHILWKFCLSVLTVVDH